MLQHEDALRHRRYITLDDFASLRVARENPESLFQGNDQVTIDEAQKAPELLQVVKRVVDQRRKNGRIILSGSANFELLKNVSESLAGRAVYFTLYPFTRREILGRVEETPFLMRFFDTLKLSAVDAKPVRGAEVLAGGMPPVAGLRKPEIWFKGYEQTYIDRDVRQLAQVADLLAYRNLMQLVALRGGQLLNASELARDTKLTVATASRYLNLLETSFILRRLPPFINNRSSRLIKSPKIYVADSGLACYLTGVENLDAPASEHLRRALYETYVAQNLAAILEAHWPSAKLMFWNVQGRYEVDFVIENKRRIFAIEMKAASRWSDADLAGLLAFLERTPNCEAAILAYNGTQAVKLRDKLWAIPLGLLLS
ncbi:MAG: ATP-binding protein [Pseudomonadota bacterium]